MDIRKLLGLFIRQTAMSSNFFFQEIPDSFIHLNVQHAELAICKKLVSYLPCSFDNSQNEIVIKSFSATINAVHNGSKLFLMARREGGRERVDIDKEKCWKSREYSLVKHQWTNECSINAKTRRFYNDSRCNINTVS